jgi:uracil DNA glycosylase
MSMINGLSEPTKDVVVRKLKTQLTEAITSINKKMSAEGLTRESLSPPPHLIMNAFRITDIDKIRIVLLG